MITKRAVSLKHSVDIKEKIMSQLKIWWIPQVPMPAFRREVDNLVEAKLLLDTLATYDIFQYENHLKGNYCNVGGLEVYDTESQEWIEWYDLETGDNINSFSLTELREKQLTYLVSIEETK